MVLIIGMFPAQLLHLQRRHKNVRYWDKGKPLRLLSGIDRVILATKFINHTHQQDAIRLYGRDRVVLVWGGLSALDRAIKRIPQVAG